MAVAALCLFVEYAWSCAAVAVDWSGKVLRDFHGLPEVVYPSPKSGTFRWLSYFDIKYMI